MEGRDLDLYKQLFYHSGEELRKTANSQSEQLFNRKIYRDGNWIKLAQVCGISGGESSGFIPAIWGNVNLSKGTVFTGRNTLNLFYLMRILIRHKADSILMRVFITHQAVSILMRVSLDLNLFLFNESSHQT